MQIRSLAELADPDQRALRFTPGGLSMAGVMPPELACKFEQEAIARCDLSCDVVQSTRDSFERLRTLHSYGVMYYDAFTVADDVAWLVMEQAFRDRFVVYFDKHIPFVDSATGNDAPLPADDFELVYRAVSRGGVRDARRWKLRLRSTGELIQFAGTFKHLQNWARSEGLLHGQRNRQLEDVYRRLRNFVAHPSYHLVGPTDSARTISDLAEIINRLWGHPTPGGRLYPAPLQRGVLIIGWAPHEVGLTRSLLNPDQLATTSDDGSWTYLVIRGVSADEEQWEFDTRFERTQLPCQLLWGPGRREDARSWLENEHPADDSVEYLDRIFAMRLHDGKVSLPRRPEVTLTLPSDRRDGYWRVVRADFPGDAFVHARHIRDGQRCGARGFASDQRSSMGPPSLPPCAVEDVAEGDWLTIAEQLRVRFGFAPLDRMPDVYVPARWSLPDNVEAD